MELLKSADNVLVIRANGTVSTQSPDDAIKEYAGKGFLDDFSDDGDDISDRGSQDDSPARHYIAPEPKDPIAANFRPTGDLALYKYYLTFVSKPVFILWLVVVVVLVVTERGPGILKPNCQHNFVYTLIVRHADIYMRLWIERDPENKLFFVGYAAFGVVTVFLNLAWSGCVAGQS